jgi:hypothetical protein
MARRSKLRRIRPGELAIIGKDCREGKDVSNQEAVYEGRFFLNTEKRYTGPREHFLGVNPRFKLADGSRIWGIECWWIPKKEAKDFAL